MPIAAGSRVGPYEITEAIGAGGMGEVYRGRDSRLKRDVAIKVLPALFADDPERLARFEREAQTLAALNHPHIATIFGIENGPGGSCALVMELVDGDTLAEHIERAGKPGLTLRDTLAIARQIAEGLEAAHEKGIIHRDLKPANIKLTSDGSVKILDFGLAKAMTPEASTPSADAINSPTLTARATQMGMLLGTAPYMAPEQARGKSVDRRADIWSFGCVLFEMLTGRRAFEGEEITDVLARVIEREPDWSAIPASTPSDVRRLLARCLNKDSKIRLRDIGEARVAIDDALAGRNADVVAPAATVLPAPSSRRLLPWGLTVGFALVAAFILVAGSAPIPAGRQVRVNVTLPADVEFYSGPSLSTDGSALVFVATRQGVRQVYRRTLDDANVRPIPGTETASVAAISPDGTSGAFISPDTRLRRVSFATGLVEPLADGAITSSWPAWAGDDAIVFSRPTGLVVRERDGKERELAKVDAAGGEAALSWPVIASGGESVLFASRRNSARGTTFRLETVPLAGGGRRVVLDGGEQPIFASADRLVFRREGALFIAPFDGLSVTVTGQASRQNEAVTITPSGGFAAAVAPVGTLVTAPPSVLEAQMVWVSMNGVERIIRGPARAFLSPRVSPDGRLIAFVEAATIWTLDPERGTFTRVTSHVDPTISFPCWSSDGRRIYYRSSDGIRVQRADGEGASTLLPNTRDSDYPNAATPDGGTLIIQRVAPSTAADIYAMPANGGELTPIVVTNAYEAAAQVSPDGKWLLYVSNESGRMEVDSAAARRRRPEMAGVE